MIVVADTSPFIGLLKIGHVDVLYQLYGTVIIPSAVANELGSLNRPLMVQSFIKMPPTWISVRNPVVRELISGLDEGESAAIHLASELSADLLLIDETKGREEAAIRRIPTVRTAAILVEAANVGLLNLRDAFDKLRATNFRVPEEALDALLKRHEMFVLQKKGAAGDVPKAE